MSNLVKKLIEKEKITVISLLLIVSLVPPLLVFERIRFYCLPVGGDTGDWVRATYAIFENSYPMWGDSPLPHGPLLYFVIYPLSKFLGEIWAINITGLLLLALRPLAIFIFVNKMFKSRFFALLVAGVDAFFPSYFEMYSFGGYPNLLGFVILPITFIYLLEYSQDIKLKNFTMLSLLSTVVILSHHLTSIIFLGTTFLWSVQGLLKKQFKLTFQTLFATALPMVIYILVTGGTSEYNFTNEFAYYGLVINMQKILYVFKNSFMLLLLIILSVIGIFALSRNNKRGAFLLISWLLFPIIFYIGSYCTKFIIIDYSRLLFFLVQPLIISTVYSLKILWEKKNKLLVLGLVCVLIASSFNFGYITMSLAITYNKAGLERRYSDINAYDMVNWVKMNLQENSTIASRIIPSVMSRFIAGYAHKRVLMGGTPEFLFKINEYERSLACEDILTSNIIGRSDMFKIKDQTPLSFGRTPFIYIFGGDDYKLLGYFNDHYPYELKKLTLNVSEVNIGNDFYKIIYSDSYRTVKKVMLKDDEVQVNYTILQDPYKISREKLGKSLYSNFWLGKNWEFKDNRTLITDYGEVDVITNAISVQKEYVSQWKQWRLVFTFDSELSVTFKVKDIRMVKGSTVLTTRDDLIKQYGVTHALVRVDDTEAMRWIQSTGDWKLIYNNTLFYLYSLEETWKL